MNDSVTKLIGSERYVQLDAHIGEGTYGKVEKARDLVDNTIVAIKKVKVEGLTEGTKNDKEVVTNSRLNLSSIGIHFTVLRELKVMCEIDHPNIISIKDVFIEEDFINLVMPYMVSDLRKVLERRIRLNEAQVKCIILQIAQGLAELHASWILHRDLAPANIFINSQGVCKVADFGLSRCYGSPRPNEKSSNVVTLWYRPPELLYGATYYQDKVDIWSFGCIFAELLQGGQPLFPGQGEIDQLSRIFSLLGTPTEENWPHCSELPLYFEFTKEDPKPFSSIFMNVSNTAIDLLEKTLTLDPSKRLSAAKVIF